MMTMTDCVFIVVCSSADHIYTASDLSQLTEVLTCSYSWVWIISTWLNAVC